MSRQVSTQNMTLRFVAMLACTAIAASLTTGVPSAVAAPAQLLTALPMATPIPTALTLNESSRTLVVGQKFTAKVKTVTPSNASKSVKWSTSDKAVATVSSAGKITAKKSGIAFITATSTKNPLVSNKVTVTVIPDKPTAIYLNVTSSTWAVGQKFTVKVASVTPSVVSKSVKWTTSDKKVATVSAKGKITAKKAGTAVITATSTKDKTIKATLGVTVIPNKPTQLSLNAKVQALLLKKTFTAKVVSVTPSIVSKSVKWTTSNKKIATVSSKGKITAKKYGTAVITATSTKDKTVKATLTVVVSKKPTQMTPNIGAQTLAAGQSVTISVTSVVPADAYKGATWVSSDNKIATVSATGVVTGVKVGTATITGTSELNSALKVSATVNVTASGPGGGGAIPVTSVTLSPTSGPLIIGQTLQLTPSVLPSNATNQAVSWTSSNSSVATVSGGRVTAVRAGSATITVKTVNGNKTATAAITVVAAPVAVTGVTIAPTSASITRGGTLQFSAAVAPSNATNKSVSWSSTNTSIATVNSSGLVTAVGVGTAKIAVITTDGNKTASAAITVTAPIPASSVALNIETYKSFITAKKQLSAFVTPQDATNKTVTWTSSAPTVASVDGNGLVTSHKEGTAKITATTHNGKTASAQMQVFNFTAQMILNGNWRIDFQNPGPVAATFGQPLSNSFTATLDSTTFQQYELPDEAITWSSSNISVATVAQSGLVTPVSPGSATISVQVFARPASVGSYTVNVANPSPQATVSFNGNGGDAGATSKIVTVGQPYGVLPTAERTNNTFTGWFTAATGGSQVTTSTTVTNSSNHTLYAHWTPQTTQIVVSFNANGGSVGTTSKTLVVGEAYGTLPVPTRSNYTFAGWYTAATGGSQVLATTTVTNSSSHTLYAHWTSSGAQQTVNILLDSSCYWPEDAARTYFCTSGYTGTVRVGSAYGSLPTPTFQDGMVAFDGWWTQEYGGTKITASTIVTNTSDHIIYGHWKARVLTSAEAWFVTANNEMWLMYSPNYGEASAFYTFRSNGAYSYSGSAGVGVYQTAGYFMVKGNQLIFHLRATRDGGNTWSQWYRDVYTYQTGTAYGASFFKLNTDGGDWGWRKTRF